MNNNLLYNKIKQNIGRYLMMTKNYLAHAATLI